MDFGDILDEWDRMGGRGASSRESVLAEKGCGKGEACEGDASDPRREARKLAALKPQATLDLHGMTEVEAEAAIGAFIEASARQGLEKVLVIHGKGLHSEGGRPVLKRAARRVLESHPLAGRMGEAGRDEGGSGALWVAIRKRK